MRTQEADVLPRGPPTGAACIRVCFSRENGPSALRFSAQRGLRTVSTHSDELNRWCADFTSEISITPSSKHRPT